MSSTTERYMGMSSRTGSCTVSYCWTLRMLICCKGLVDGCEGLSWYLVLYYCLWVLHVWIWSSGWLCLQHVNCNGPCRVTVTIHQRRRILFVLMLGTVAFSVCASPLYHIGSRKEIPWQWCVCRYSCRANRNGGSLVIHFMLPFATIERRVMRAVYDSAWQWDCYYTLAVLSRLVHSLSNAHRGRNAIISLDVSLYALLYEPCSHHFVSLWTPTVLKSVTFRQALVCFQHCGRLWKALLHKNWSGSELLEIQ